MVAHCISVTRLHALLPLVVLPWFADAGGCLTSDVHYVTASEPPCCTAELSPLIATLANRTVHDSSADSLLSQLVFPGAEHFGSSSVASRPRFERRQKIFGKLYVSRLYAVSQKSQQYTLLFDMYWRWRDCRMIFNGSSTSGPLDINAQSPLFAGIWTPEVVFKEESHSTERRNLDQSLLLFGDGMITLRQQFSRQLACSFDLTNLPFDTQTCTITVSMPEFTSDRVELHWDPDPLEMESITNGEWVISGYGEWKQSLAKSSFSAKGPGPKRSISALTVSFSMTRKTHDLVVSFIVPSAVYWLCSYGGLWVDASAVPGRVALGLIPILTLNNKMGQLRGLLPPVNTSSRLENFILSTLLLTIFQLVEFCLLNFAIRVAKEAKLQRADRQVEPELLPSIVPNAWERPRRGRCLPFGLCLSCATWAQNHLDHFARWFFLALFVILLLGTLRPWDV